MGAYLIRRILNSLLVLAGVSLISFYILHAAPGDPVQMFLQQPFNEVPQSLIDAVRKEMGLDRPVYIQYLEWLKRFVVGDLGYSYVHRTPVVTHLLDAIPRTLLLMGVSTLVGLVLGVLLGIYSALRPNTWVDALSSAASSVGYALPRFWVGLIFIWLFSYVWPVLPSSGMQSPYALEPSTMDLILHMILPVTTLAFNEIAYWQRYQRDSLLSVMGEDYIRTARAKGLRAAMVVFKHGWRNSLVVMVTLLGLSLTRLLTGSYIVETIFSWPGMGNLGVWAINNRDYPMVMAILMLSATLTIVGNLLTDIAYAYVDPRVRFGGGGGS